MTVTARVSRVIPADADEIWKTMTSKAGMKAYMMGADVDADWRVGGRITMKGEFNGKPYEDTGEVRSFDPGRRLAYTHVSSAEPGVERLVTFDLRPSSDGAEVTVTQENADGGVTDADRKNRDQYEKMWGAMLEGLEKAVRT